MDLTRPLTRRDVLRLGAAVAAVAGVPMLISCGSPLPVVTSSPSAAGGSGPSVGPSASAGPVTGDANFFGWTPGSVKMEPILAEFARQYPGVNMQWTGFTSPQYQEQMTTIFVSGVPRVDALWLREEAMGGWIQAGYLQPIDDFPRVDEYKKLMYPGSLEDALYEDKLYGLPYYTSWQTFVVNKKMLASAGISTPPKTWDELKTALLAIKTAGILDVPFTFALKSASEFFEWWSLVYASGGDLFDANMDPVFDQPDSVALEVLERLVDLTESGLLDPASLELTNTGSRDVFMAGQTAMTVTSGQYFIQISDPTASKVVDDYLVTDIPSLTGTMERTVQFTRQYGIGAKAKDPLAAYQVIEFMSGYDTAGVHWVQDYLTRTAALQSAYPEVIQTTEIQALLKTWFGDQLDLVQAQLAKGKARQALKTTWFSQWNGYNQQQIQDTILGKIKPADALKASADRAREVKKASA